MKSMELADILITYFNRHELEELMFEMALAPEEVSRSASQKVLVYDFISYLERRNRVDELLERIHQHRPHISFDPSTLSSKVEIEQNISSAEGGVSFGVAIDEIKGNISTGDINRYLSQDNIETRPLHEAKMILVGEGDVGKTSLVRRLVYNEFDAAQSMTEGIAIEPWSITIKEGNEEIDIRINIWDFGGQGVYHSTHQLFFTKRSVYLLVIDARRGEKESRLDYWFKLIESFGENAPVIIVTNQIDIHPLELNENKLFRDHRNLADIVYTSCRDGYGIEELHGTIEKTITTLPHIHDELFVSWFRVKEALEKLRRKKKDYIDIDRYIEICEEAGVVERNDQKTLLSFLHDLGVVLHFQDDKQLEDTQILNPDWITAGIYKILSSAELKKQEGKLDLSQLDTILDPKAHPSWKHPYVINMMKKFELCFPLDIEGEQYLIPDLLPAKEPKFLWDYEDCISLSFVYQILPASIMTRFIVRMMSQTSPKDTLFWLSGALIEYEDNRALITADGQKINVWVTGSIKTRRQFLSVVRAQIKDVNRSIANLVVEEVVPLPNYPDRTITYRELRNLEERNVPMPYYYAAVDDYIDVGDLLDGIEMLQERNLTDLRNKMMNRFSDQEIRDICFELPKPPIYYEDLPGEGTSAKIRELIQKMDRLGRIPDLITICQSKRPDEIW